MIRLKIGDRINYQNYWDSKDKGVAKIVFVEDTIFQPFDEREDEELSYEVEDEETGKVFEVDDNDYLVELI